MASGTTFIEQSSESPGKESDNLDIVVHGRHKPPSADRDVPKVVVSIKENIVNSYKKIGFFGRGNFGNCYEYEEINTNVKYAVKVIRKKKGKTPPKVETIDKKRGTLITEHAFKEANIQEPLQHQNIVRLFYAFDDNIKFVYIFMEPCIHGNLDEVLRNRGILSALESRYYIRQLVSGCQYLRENLVVHRDLKPKNLFIDSNMVLKIGDFGLAIKLKDIDDQSFFLCGTPHYMAPEMVCGEGHGFEVDVWAVGCILFELMVGFPPFVRPKPRLTWEAIIQIKELPIPDFISVPPSGLELMLKLLDKEPKYRLIPRQILRSKFIREEPKIPRRLPSSLLLSLSTMPEVDIDSQAFCLEHVVASIIARSPETEYDPEPGYVPVAVPLNDPGTNGRVASAVPLDEAGRNRHILGAVVVHELKQNGHAPCDETLEIPETNEPVPGALKVPETNGHVPGAVVLDIPEPKGHVSGAVALDVPGTNGHASGAPAKSEEEQRVTSMSSTQNGSAREHDVDIALTQRAFEMTSGTIVKETKSETSEEESSMVDIVVHGRHKPPADDSDIPKRIFRKDKQYKQIGYFGAGSFGNCYEYMETKTKVKYAVKVIRKVKRETPPKSEAIDKKNDSIVTEHAYTEAGIQKPLRHQNIVKFFFIFNDNEKFVNLFMEPCIHGSLDDVKKNRGRLSTIETRYYIRQLSLGCQYLRQNLVVHGDLKPTNLFIDRNMVLKIGDFGLAIKLKNINDKSLSLGGTANYMAPEAVNKAGQSFEVDMWAVGCILYELMVGQRPFASPTRELIFKAILEVEELTIPEFITLPPSALFLMYKLLEKNPKDRFTPTKTINASFIREGPIIPLRLPSSLLSRLPEITGYNSGEQVLSLEEVIENYISGSIENIYGQERGPSQYVPDALTPALDAPKPSQRVPGAGTLALDAPGPSEHVPGVGTQVQRERSTVLTSSTRSASLRSSPSRMIAVLRLMARLCGCGRF